MKAETVYNVLQALSPEEEERFYRMLGIVKAVPNRTKRKPIISKEESMEYLMATLTNKKPTR